MCDQITNCGVTRSQSGSGHVTGIQWYEKFPEALPGRLYMECERLSASLTHEQCQQNWLQATSIRPATDEPSRFAKCRSCVVGLTLHTDHASPVGWADVRSSIECLRCGRRALRLIGGEVCVSCWNREREGKLNRDARGNAPKTRMVLSQRRVGLVIDGKPVWRRFDAWHEGEVISRAIRQVDGARFTAEQPGKSVWNQRVGIFQYRCDKHPGEFGTLRELVADNGATEYVCPVCQPGRAKGLPEARVCAPTSIYPREFIREVVGTFCDEPIEAWKATEFVCDRCEYYALQVRTIGKQILCRCPMCDVTH